MYSPEAVSALIGEVYEGVIEPSRWNGAIRRFVDMSSGKLAFFAVIDSATASLPVSSVVGPETSRLADALELHRELVPLDPGVPYALARPHGGVFRFCDTSAALTREPETWRDFILHELGSGDYQSRFSAETDGVSLVLALHSDGSVPKLTSEQEQLHAIMFDHLQRAARLAYRPPDLGSVGQPVLVVDANAKLLDANLPAEDVLSEGDGLDVTNGRLAAANPFAHKTLRKLIRHTCRGYQDGPAEHYCTVSRPSGQADYVLRLGPLPLPDLGMAQRGYRCLITFLGAAPRHYPTPEHLSQLFDLTPREGEIAALFASSFNDLRSIADYLGISHETARVHARSIYAKLKVTNQVELVRALARLS